MTTPPAFAPDQARRLGRLRALARAALTFEALWPALWPPLGVLGAYLCAALLDIPARLPFWAHLALLIGTLGAAGWLAWRALGPMRRPGAAEADRRLESAGGLRHRPLAVLTDRPAAGTATDALWRAHVARAAAELGRLRVGLPRPGLARRDPRALRGALIVGLVAALTIAGTEGPSRVAGALAPRLPAAAAGPAVQVQAWITPPPYTGQPPVFLRVGDPRVTVPAGSHLTVNVSGGDGEPLVALGGRKLPPTRLDAASWQVERDLSAPAPLALRQAGREIGAWDIDVAADRSPMAAWAEPPGRASRSLQTRLPWSASDDYGVILLQAELRLRDRPDAPAVVVPLPLPGGRVTDAHGVGLHDLTANPWAGLPVIARLIAQDGAGQRGQSADAEFVLPMRTFRNPVAQRLLAVRQGLSLRPDDRRAAADALGAILGAHDEPLGDDLPAVVELGAVVALLGHERAADATAEAQSRLWDLALHLEEGRTERTARGLEAARRAAQEAIERAGPHPDEAARKDIEQKLQALQDAIAQHMQALADEARREGAKLDRDPDARKLSERDMQRTAEAARDAARNGDMDRAREKMAELEQMLDQLRDAHMQAGNKPRDGKQGEQRQKGRQQMGALQDMIAREGGLLDHSQVRLGQGQIDPMTGRPAPSPPVEGDPARARHADGVVQQALRRALGELMQQFGDLTGEVPPSMGDADGAMKEAAGALGLGHDGPAAAAEQRAIEALQKAGKDMNQKLAQQSGHSQKDGQNGQQSGEQEGDQSGAQMGQDGEGDGEGEGDRSGETGLGMDDHDDNDQTGARPGSQSSREGRNDKRDPFGRQTGDGASGADEGSDVRVPEEMERQRTRAILDELRRRDGERMRPREELDYIDRLLRQF